MAGLAYGIRIESELEFEGLPPANNDGLTVRLEVERKAKLPPSPGTLISTYGAQRRTARLFVGDSFIAFQMEDFLCFELLFSHRFIRCYAVPTITDDFLRYWFLQQILPLYLILGGHYEFLHAAAVTVKTEQEGIDASTRCVAFLGPSYTGKSTMTSHFLSRGHILLTDDHLALSGENLSTVTPALPYYRPYRALEDLGIYAQNYVPQPRTLQAGYILQPVGPDDPVHIEPLSGPSLIATLLQDTQYAIHDPKNAPQFLPLVQRRFHGLAALSRSVRFATIQVPRSKDRLEEVYRCLREDLEG